MNVFFDVDYTLISIDGRLRPHVREVFEQLKEDGHSIYIWSGVGIRRREMREHELEHLIDGVYWKPLENHRASLSRLGVDVIPDFVIDDHREVVQAFPGTVIRPYGFSFADDQEMWRVYEEIQRFSESFGFDELRPSS